MNIPAPMACNIPRMQETTAPILAIWYCLGLVGLFVLGRILVCWKRKVNDYGPADGEIYVKMHLPPRWQQSKV